METGNESLKENIRLAVKALLESPDFGYRVIPTLEEWNFQSENETLAKIQWSGTSQAISRQAHSFLRRQDTLHITVATPNTAENWQDKTSLIEENFNYSKMNQAAIVALMPEGKRNLLGDVDISEISLIMTGTPEAYALSKISVKIQYAILQGG